MGALAGSSETAVRLAAFLTALRQFAPEDQPAGHACGNLTAGSLRDRDRGGRRRVRCRSDDRPLGRRAARPWVGPPPVWFHGDFHTGNLLTVGGRLSAVTDFGGLGIGDPACDRTIAFTLMTDDGRAALGVDDDTWARGLGWA